MVRSIFLESICSFIHNFLLFVSGTQVKMAVRLEGDQYALWKPQQFGSYKEVPSDTPYSGADRHYAEIAAFYIGWSLRDSYIYHLRM